MSPLSYKLFPSAVCRLPSAFCHNNAIAVLEQLPEEQYETPTDIDRAVGAIE